MTTSLQRRHFESIASALVRARLYGNDNTLSVARELTRELGRWNPAFDAQRFMVWCGFSRDDAPKEAPPPAVSRYAEDAAEEWAMIASKLLAPVPPGAGIGPRALARRMTGALGADNTETIRFWLRSARKKDGALNTEHPLSGYVATLIPLAFASAF